MEKAMEEKDGGQPIKGLLIETSFPALANDIIIAKAQIEASGSLPPADGLSEPVALDVRLWYVVYLMQHGRSRDAAMEIDRCVFSDVAHKLPPLHLAWLWLARMTIFVEGADYMLALGSAENALGVLSQITGKKTNDFLAIVASLLYNLAVTHNALGDSSRATKELTKAQRLLERLSHKDGARFSAMLLCAVEASAHIFKSRNKQMEVYAHYQQMTEIYTSMLDRAPDTAKARSALRNLIHSLKKEGDIMLETGNGRNAVRYYTKALRYQKKLSDTLGYDELVLSIGLAKALMRLINRRAAAEQLLQSLLPLARRLNANAEIVEIENLLNNKNKNFNIMTLLKSIFTAAILLAASLGLNAQQIVGHRGSVWGVENTEAAFRNGAASGAWGLECDIHLTKDGAWVVCHDGDMKRVGGPATGFSQMNLDEVLATPLKQVRKGVTYVGHLMSLGQYLDLCRELGKVPVIEIKAEECVSIHSQSDKDPENTCLDGVPALMNLIAQKGYTDDAIIISFMPEVIEYIHKQYPKFKVQALAGGKEDPQKWIKWCKKRHIDLDASYKLISPELVKELHEAGLKVNCWTVDNPEIFNRMKECGVDFITTNMLFPEPVSKSKSKSIY